MLSVYIIHYAQQSAGIIGGSLILYFLVYAWACTGLMAFMIKELSCHAPYMEFATNN